MQLGPYQYSAEAAGASTISPVIPGILVLRRLQEFKGSWLRRRRQAVTDDTLDRLKALPADQANAALAAMLDVVAPDADGLIDGASAAMTRIADELAPRCPNLAELLRHRPAGGTPLLAAAFAYFLRRDVETNAELARGLTFDGLTHGDRATVEQRTVHGLHRGSTHIVGFHLVEGKAAAAAGLAIHDHFRRGYGPELRERFLKTLGRDRVGQIAHKQFTTHS